jgi:hypothetical protein
VYEGEADEVRMSDADLGACLMKKEGSVVVGMVFESEGERSVLDVPAVPRCGLSKPYFLRRRHYVLDQDR